MEKEIKDILSLSEDEMGFMNFEIEKEFGKEYIRKFKEYYPSEAKCFFIKEEKEIVAFGIINPIVADYLEKKYDLYGIENVLAIRKGQGYGKDLMRAILEYLDEHKLNGIGFCARKNTLFYKKMEMKTSENLMRRFRYKNPKKGKVSIAGNGDGIFYGDGDFFKDILKTDEPVYLNVELW